MASPTSSATPTRRSSAPRNGGPTGAASSQNIRLTSVNTLEGGRERSAAIGGDGGPELGVGVRLAASGATLPEGVAAVVPADGEVAGGLVDADGSRRRRSERAAAACRTPLAKPVRVHRGVDPRAAPGPEVVRVDDHRLEPIGAGSPFGQGPAPISDLDDRVPRHLHAVGSAGEISRSSSGTPRANGSRR
jgi:hypothetical protein